MELYKDAKRPVEERVEDLLSRMTLREKIGQLSMRLFGWKCYEKKDGEYELTDVLKDEVERCEGLGGLYGLFRADPWSGVKLDIGIPMEKSAKVSNMLQRYVIEHSRLGIPVLLAEECPHGLQGLDGVVYPTNIGAACSFDPAARAENYRHTAVELRARGAHMALVSTLDMLIDPRWGRSEECYGEDPYMASRMTEEIVRSMQGDDLTQAGNVAVQLKHYACQGAAVGGHNGYIANIGEREMREIHLPAARAGVEAGVQSFMATYTSVDGVPCNASRKIVTDILRGEMGFDGFVLSDGSAVDNLTRMTGGLFDKGKEPHAKAAALALNAGVDMALWGRSFLELETAYDEGLISEETVDEAVRRILRVKFRLGLFENPYVDEAQPDRVDFAAARASALRMAQESLVLLKNEGEILPLDPKQGTIAVIGPNVDCLYNQLGDYVAPQKPEAGVTPLAGIRALSKGARVVYTRGCGIRDMSKEGFAEAVELAQNADVAVLVLGGCSTREFDTQIDEHGAVVVGGAMEMNCGEGVDVSDLKLGGVQIDLVREIAKTGTPIVAVLVEGRPHSVEELLELCPAILNAWYPGQEGGTAIAQALFGEYNPGGKLACSIAKHVGQLPVYYNRHLPYPRPYLDNADEPRYGFGYGLSYTKFALDGLVIDNVPSCAQLLAGEKVNVRVNVRNIGERVGDEVVQMYIHDAEASVNQRVWELKGFERVHLAPGEAKTVEFTLGERELSVWDVDMKETLEPGNVIVKVTNGADQTLQEQIVIEEK
ncbi:MAG: glycoside hydrolase family 3 N-terminal domain-containing protein [Eubacteriales bacterium]|nr:glycoside hydrolase family 3 N-terminal domain-containing protein [Eubacteriales bacterium]